MSVWSQLAPQSFTYPGSGRGRIDVAGLRELEALRTIKGDHRGIQRDPYSCGFLEGVRSLRDDPCKVGVHFDVLGEAAPLLVDATTKGCCDLISNLHRDVEVGPSLNNDPCEVASKDSSRAGETPRVYSCEG